MARFLGFAFLRGLVAIFFLLTAAYGVAAASPFAFDMIIRPQIFPAVAFFAAWHHLLYLAVFLISLLTIAPSLRARTKTALSGPASRSLALAYAAVFGGVGAWLVGSPYLPRLWNDGRGLVVAAASFVPLLWLAAIDHCSAWQVAGSGAAGTGGDRPEAEAPDQRRLLIACGAAAAYLWGAHLLRALWREPPDAAAPWVLSSVWTLTLAAALFGLLYCAMSVVEAAAACARARQAAWRHGLATAILAGGIAEALRRIVFVAISLDASAAAWLSAIAGSALAASWAGVALRRPARRRGRVAAGFDTLLAPEAGRASIAAALIVLPLGAAATLAGIERFDWGAVLQRLVIVVEFAAAFALWLAAAPRFQGRAWSQRLALAPPVAALALLFIVPRAALVASVIAGDRRLEPGVAFDRHAAAESSAVLIANELIERPGFDVGDFSFPPLDAGVSANARVEVPRVDLIDPSGPAGASLPPDVFLFVVDSLRRDYVGAYNPAVTFTPSLDRFAADSAVFRNAFTRYGGTELAIPSIWAGGPVVRAVHQSLDRINTLEKLVKRRGYRLAMSDYTIAGFLDDGTVAAPLEPGVPGTAPDLCRAAGRLAAFLDEAADGAPVAGYARPMNVHILNWRGQTSLDGDYPGFYAPYASRLRRLDGCFGAFTDYLKRTGRYDRSVIVVTGDHGDSLGEEGHWGHAFWLNPEDVRVPLIVHVPAALRGRLTTDLGRLAFTTDIAPTIAALAGERVRRDPLFGEPLFVPVGERLSDRRRRSFLIASSYGPTYALVRRNGRSLFVSDRVERRESLFTIVENGPSTRAPIDDDIRWVSQRSIRAAAAEIAAFYRPAAASGAPATKRGMPVMAAR
ncbi:MAG: sulfatase-like hydrolase/transferase [Acidobacteria bacterium]|nr:sulfatase-like hydrolase/transferase [Acidobacteriota bacterium]